jgi:hypothetical protein
MRLLSNSLFNLAYKVLNFSGVPFSITISFQVGVLRELAGLMLDCAFDFVNRGPKFHKFGSLVRYAEEELTRWEQAQPSGGENIAERFMPQPVRSNGPVGRAR